MLSHCGYCVSVYLISVLFSSGFGFQITLYSLYVYELKLDKNFPNPRFQVENVGYINLLIIRNVSKEDEATYLCQAGAAYNLAFVNGTNLIVNGKISSFFGFLLFLGSETLQCSVLSDSNITTCSGDPSVFWFRSRSEKSFPDMIYTDGKKSENCKKRSDSPKRCFYNFYKNISSSDAGTYYCAVATCGQIIFGNEIKNAAIICLVISTEAGPDLNYAALHFSEGRTSRGKKKRELMTEESVYSQVKG
uniref:Ig-like domain-containing protein n=1 Tax=Poecilia mexicana TaxID=48701 RepID=A0A3B3X6P4_9TELE